MCIRPVGRSSRPNDMTCPVPTDTMTICPVILLRIKDELFYH